MSALLPASRPPSAHLATNRQKMMKKAPSTKDEFVQAFLYLVPYGCGRPASLLGAHRRRAPIQDHSGQRRLVCHVEAHARAGHWTDPQSARRSWQRSGRRQDAHGAVCGAWRGDAALQKYAFGWCPRRAHGQPRPCARWPACDLNRHEPARGRFRAAERWPRDAPRRLGVAGEFDARRPRATRRAWRDRCRHCRRLAGRCVCAVARACSSLVRSPLTRTRKWRVRGVAQS